jgi:hypothetical protein
VIDSREKRIYTEDNRPTTRFVLSLPQRDSNRQKLNKDQKGDIKVYVEVSPGHFNIYLNLEIVATILGLEQENYSLTLPAPVILQLVYQGYLQEGWRSGITFCGYSWMSADPDDLDLLTRTFVSIDGDVINQVKRDFIHHPQCLSILRACYWLYQQILSQIQSLLNTMAGNLTGVVTTSLLTFQVGNRFLQQSGLFPFSVVWFFLNGITVLWFWWWSQKARSRLAQFLQNRLPRFSFPAFLNTPPWQIASTTGSLGLILVISQEDSGMIWSILLFPFLYHTFRTQILPLVSRWFLSGLFSSPRLQRIIATFL